MNSGWKIVTKIGSFPFLRRPTRFRKFSVAETALDLCTFKLLLHRLWSLKEKLCTEHLFLWLPQTLEDGRYPVLESLFLGFIWAHYVTKQWSLFNSSSVILLQRLVPNSSTSRALQTSGLWLMILLRIQITIFLWRDNKVKYTILWWLPICSIIQLNGRQCGLLSSLINDKLTRSYLLCSFALVAKESCSKTWKSLLIFCPRLYEFYKMAKNLVIRY